MTPARVLRQSIAAFIALCVPALAADGTTALQLADVGVLLGKLLLVLVLLESAMAAIFNWRVYRVVLQGRAWKTPIMFALGLLVVLGFDYDFMNTAITGIAGVQGAEGLGWVSVTLSALVVAGGSQGVHDILKKLGLRSPLPDPDQPPSLKEDQAWLALRIRRKEAVGDIQIMITPTDHPPENALVGSVDDRPLGLRLAEAFGMADLRFPRTGGRVVKPGVTYDIALRFSTAEEQRMTKEIGRFAFAPRAVVDLDLTA